MRVLDLFSGVGMFSYAWRKLGWETVAFVEIDKFCQRVLKKHWPDVPIYDDVREISYERLQGIGTIDLICGGFPCTDLSVAGKQAGIDGKRSGLWSEFARIIGEFKPRWVVVENVAALLSGDDGHWMGRVLGDLAKIGYDCEWHCIPAGNPDGLSAGAPHRRERVWIVAYPNSKREQPKPTEVQRKNGEVSKRDYCSKPDNTSEQRGYVADTLLERQQGQGQPINTVSKKKAREGQTDKSFNVSQPQVRSTEPSMGLLAHGITAELSRSRWLPEPGIGRVATEVPDRVNKLKALGNGLVWQIPYAIGKAIMERK